MRVLLVDLPGRDGVVSKDTVVGGYGSRLVPFCRVTSVIGALKRRMHDVPSVQLAYIAGILAQYGHEVVWSTGAMPAADVAIVLSSLVDYRQEASWADEARARGIHTGFVGLTASKMPELFRDHADFLIMGEPESAVQRLARGRGAARRLRQRSDCGSRRAALAALGFLARGAAAVSDAGRGAAAPRRHPAAGEPRLPGVLHLLPASHPRGLPRAVRGQHHRRARSARPRVQSPLRDLPRSVVHGRSRPRDGARRRHSIARPEPALRMRDPDRSARSGAARRAPCGRPPHHELRRRVGVGRHPQESRAAADPGSAAPADHQLLPAEGHRHGGLLRARISARRLGVDRRHDRLFDRPRLVGGAVQAADAVPRHAAVETARRRRSSRRTGRSSTASRRPSSTPRSARPN